MGDRPIARHQQRTTQCRKTMA